MSARVLVFDSSAMLALLKGEAGGQIVLNLLADSSNEVYAHATNLCEVFYDFGAPSIGTNQADAEAALAALKAAGIVECNDMDSAFWRDVALIIAERRAQPPSPAKPKEKPRLALGDAFGIALARRLGGEFVTADRAEIEAMEAAGFCRVVFIR